MHKAHIRLRFFIFAGKRDFCSCFRFRIQIAFFFRPHKSAAMLESDEEGYLSDSSVVLPMRPVKQVSVLDVLSAAACPNKHAVVTPSKIQSLLDEEEEEDEVSADEDQENRTPDVSKPLIKEETPFKLYLHSSPDSTPRDQQPRQPSGVLHQIQNVNNLLRGIKKQIDLVQVSDFSLDDEDVPLNSLRKKLIKDLDSTILYFNFIEILIKKICSCF
jgi:hypothetical protein